MKKKLHTILIALGTVSFLSYWIVGLWALFPAFNSIATSRHPFSLWLFALSTLLLLTNLTAWPVLILHWLNPFSIAPTERKRYASALKFIAVTVFPQLILWFRETLFITVNVVLPSLELWFMALALAWMTLPFVTLGAMHFGTRLVLWLDRMK